MFLTQRARRVRCLSRVKTHIVNASITPVAKTNRQFHLLYEQMLAYMTRKMGEKIFLLRKPRGLYWENKT